MWEQKNEARTTFNSVRAATSPRNVFFSLKQREISTKRSQTDFPLKKLRLMAVSDVFEAAQSCPVLTDFVRQRCRVVEVVLGEDMLFVLTQHGLAAAYSRLSFEFVGYLNQRLGESVRSLFYNSLTHSVLLVCVYTIEEYLSLHVRELFPSEIKEDPQIRVTRRLFGSECLRWPGFVEFDTCNRVILSFCSEHKVYKVWDMQSYQHLFTIDDPQIEEIRFSVGVMLVVYKKNHLGLPLQLRSLHDGQVLWRYTYLLHRQQKVDAIELLNQYIWVKQHEYQPQIFNILTGRSVGVALSVPPRIQGLLLLFHSTRFLLLQPQRISLLDQAGKLALNFQDDSLFYNFDQKLVSVSRYQDRLAVYAIDPHCSHHGCINITCLRSGRILGRLACQGTNSVTCRALSDLSVLTFDAPQFEIVAGNSQGQILLWATPF